jgi:tetratricopeptide (TPR) repeat protein
MFKPAMIFAAAVALTSVNALAASHASTRQSQKDLDDCGKENGDQATVDACTRLIQASKATHFRIDDDMYAQGQSYYSRGMSYHFMKSEDAAIADFEEALRFDPTNVLAYSELGLIYSTRRDYDEAKLYYSAALAMSRNEGIPSEKEGFIVQQLAWLAKATLPSIATPLELSATLKECQDTVARVEQNDTAVELALQQAQKAACNPSAVPAQ